MLGRRGLFQITAATPAAMPDGELTSDELQDIEEL